MGSSQSASRGISTLQTQIAKEPIIMYSKSTCPFCFQAKQLLAKGGIPQSSYTIEELNTMDDGATIQSQLQKLSGQRTVPNIFIGGKHLGGFDQLKASHQSGKLVKMLNDANVQHTFDK